jgi:hypothetical protein
MRNLDKLERIRARHLLQELSEHALTVRNAMDPQHGVFRITDEAWAEQWASLTRELDFFTAQVNGQDDPG